MFTQAQKVCQFNTTYLINNDCVLLYYLPRIPVGLGITEVDDVSVVEGIREDDVLVEGRPAT